MTHISPEDVAGWTKPSEAKPPLHTQVLVALKECAGGSGEVLDVACYIGKQVEGDATVDRWIGTGNRLETRQIAGWMTVHTMREVNAMFRAYVALAERVGVLEEALKLAVSPAGQRGE
jgi:hypothetical protein